MHYRPRDRSRWRACLRIQSRSFRSSISRVVLHRADWYRPSQPPQPSSVGMMPRLRSWRAVSPRWRGLFNNISASPRSMTSSIRARSTGSFLKRTKELVRSSPAAAGLFHLWRVVDEMDLRIRSFEHQVIAPRLFVLAVNQHPALDRCHLRRIEHFDGQALIGHDDSVRRERSLPVSRSLHCPENLFEIPAHSPGVRSRRFCQAHSPEHGEARGLMLRVKACRLGQIRPAADSASQRSIAVPRPSRFPARP